MYDFFIRDQGLSFSIFFNFSKGTTASKIYLQTCNKKAKSTEKS